MGDDSDGKVSRLGEGAARNAPISAEEFDRIFYERFLPERYAQ